MTPKIIELKQAPVVLVELPERESIGKLELKWDSPLMGGNHKVHLLNNRRYIGTLGLAKHFNEDSILGILSDLTEEQFEECVDKEEFYYKCYTDQEEIKEDGRISLLVGFSIAKDSFYSLLESENVYTENPVGETPPDIRDFIDCGDPSDYSNAYDKAVSNWEEAQSRTIDPTRTVILLKL